MASRKRRNVHNLPELAKNEELEDLFVFGYACKLFRDDERAQDVDRNGILIPWMGDSSIMIDRYDGRGHLYDLSPYDADKNKANLTELTDEEKRIEALCDEERYLELYTDLSERAVYEEEEMKRLNEALEENSYAAVGFNYDGGENEEGDENRNDGMENGDDSDDELFDCPDDLKELLPPDINLPKTVKQHNIIVKTAIFIGQQGPQMEILIKTKQKDNEQFVFMMFEDELNPYFKALVRLIKTKKYKPEPVALKRKRNDSNVSMGTDSDDDDDGDGYLHPSLMGKSKPVENISKKYQLTSEQVKDTRFGKLLTLMNSQTGRDSPAHNVAPMEPPPVPTFLQQTKQEKEQDSEIDQPPPPGTETTILPIETKGQNSIRDEIESQMSSIAPPSNLIPPPPDVQPIIDKLADYVVRNGSAFEETVKRKNDPRFCFINKGHVHHVYYEFKKQLYEKEMMIENMVKERERLAQLSKRGHLVHEGHVDPGKMSVSFSIKTKEVEAKNMPLEKKPAFAYESSDDGEGGETEEIIASHTDKVTPSIETIKEEIIDTKQDEKSVSDLEKRYAEDRLKDKLANAAREKLVQASKEKALQAERKRKAALFLSMLKSSGTKVEEPKSTSGSSSPSKSRSATNSPHPLSLVDSPERVSTEHSEVSRRSRSPDRRRSPSYRSGRSRTPPTAYVVPRRLHVPLRRRSRSRSPRLQHRDRPRWQRSPDRKRHDSPPHRSKGSRRKRTRSRSPKRSKNRSRSRSRSKRPKSRSRSKSRKKSRSQSKSHSRSRSPSKSRSKRSHSKKSSKKSRHKRSRSRSRDRKKSDRVSTIAEEPVKQETDIKASTGEILTEQSNTTEICDKKLEPDSGASGDHKTTVDDQTALGSQVRVDNNDGISSTLQQVDNPTP